jgi:hypothetical protein
VNFLKLCQELRREAAIAGVGPVSVVNQSGMFLNVVTWINDAWIELQADRPNWRFMLVRDRALALTIGESEYDLEALGVTDVQVFTEYCFRLYDTAVGLTDQCWLPQTLWHTFHTGMIGVIDPNRPTQVCVSPENHLLVRPPPDKDTYVLTYDFCRKPTSLVNDDDVPGFPEAFHSILIQRGLMSFATHQDAPEIYADAKVRYLATKRKLDANQLPTDTLQRTSAAALGEY